MNNFKVWLRQNQYSQTSIREHLKNLEYIENWSTPEGIELDGLSYQDIMSYVQSCKHQIQPKTITNRINSLRKYYEYQQEQELRADNPAKQIRLKNTKRKTIKTILKPEELEQLYNDYSSSNRQGAEHSRNKVVLGLLIWQGIDTTTLKALKTQDIDLENGTIYLPGSTRTNARNMTLHSKQILPINSYLEKWRAQLDQADLDVTALIPGNVSNMLNWLKTILQKQHKPLENIRQIRASVITHWLNQYNIRQVQYMAGHRHISSTEEYKQIDIESMKTALKKFHPFS